MITLDSAAGFIHTLASAQRIDFNAYFLHPGPVLFALEAAARNGADVHVRVERDPFGDPDGSMHDVNAEAVDALRRAGVHAEATKPGEPLLHLKAAVVDSVAWLDDRNWTGGPAERIVRDDDPGDVAAVSAALAGEPAAGEGLQMTKAGALRLEAGVIEGAGSAPLAVETESFGDGAIYNALLHRAQAQLPTRLIVAGRELAEPRNRTERSRLAHLAALGVEVRAGDPKHHDLNEKFALAAGTGWVGSANATWAGGAAGAMSDWGLATRQTDVVDGLRAAFERNWSVAKPLKA